MPPPRLWTLALLLCCTTPPARAEPPLRFAIPRLTLADALSLYARQSGRQLLFAPAEVRGRTARPVTGRMTPDAALDRLLAETGFHARRAAGGAYLLERDAMPASKAAPVRPAAPPAPPPAPPTVRDMEDIVVVGTPGGGGARQQDAAFAVTRIGADRIGRLAPNSPADILALVPGLTVETSGGKNGANIFVRGYPSGGDAEYVTFQEEGVPFFPPATLSFLENSQLVRIDETVERVEAVRGGTGALFSSGQPGVTVNIVQREGGATLAGDAKLSVTSFGDRKWDGYVSGPLDAQTRFMLGGYYGAGTGIRSPGYTVDRGGQISGNLRRRLGGDGTLLLFARYLDDRSQWLLPIPVVQQGRRITAYPGFSAGTGTLAGPDTRRGTLNDGTRYDLDDGRGARLVHLGGNWDQPLGAGLTLRDKLSLLAGHADTTGLVSAAEPPQSAEAFAARLGGQIATLRTANDNQPVAFSQPVVEAGVWLVSKRISALVNDASLEWLAGASKATIGLYAARSRSRDRWTIGNTLLLTATPQARRLDMVLADGRIVTRDGFTSGANFLVDARYTADDAAFYAVEEIRVDTRLRLDGGLRYQHHAVDGRIADNGASGPAGPDGDPLTLYDNGDARLTGTTTPVRYRGGAWSWTAGAHYAASAALGGFVRYSRGHSFPFFDNLRDGIRVAPRIDTIEGGVTLTTAPLSLVATLFHNRFDGLATTVITAGAPLASIGGARATGLELEGVARPLAGLSINVSGSWLDARYHRFYTDAGQTDLSGNRVQRQPRWQWRIEPAYDLRIRSVQARLSTTVRFMGDRFSDVQNAQLLPRFIQWDAALTLDLSARFRLQIVADNLLDTIGLTEANPRALGAQASGAIFGRPILGRAAEFSARYRF
ncbi:TonB-dependent receptor domain-containing protein [Sphingomonas morindae]|uniref:TonB-dependent receptor n=1 Tax=Sphingomonas morindae TaxID=1541170 RepID=A0ABY4XDA9_9SPHN|nr:TonB-dependent receptor [Sphingomonas morindae]USI74892.1 TonB-dependent receptor [Sphingomonas morindae]